MKIQRNILIAFIINLSFAIFEFIGGAITGSVAIASDAVHDLGDAVSIGLSYFMERKSKKQPDSIYTFGYARYSVLGGFITTFILLFGSGAVIYNAVLRVFNPVPIDYSGMIAIAVIGVFVNFVAAWFTREEGSINQKAVNLHMIEDVLGWIVVLIGAVIMHFTDIAVIDPVMSICVALVVFVNALNNLKQVTDLFLEKLPDNVNLDEIKEHILEIEGIADVHHIHIWSMDGYNNYATMHIVTDRSSHEIKEKIRNELKEHNIGHVTLELEDENEHCHDEVCHVEHNEITGHHHHHHH